MTTAPTRAGAALALVVAVGVGGLTGCTGADATAPAASTSEAEHARGGSSTSRHLYTSLEEMVADADLIVTAIAGAQQVSTDTPGSAMTTTETTLDLEQTLTPDATAGDASTVVVRQNTAAPGWTSSEPEATLKPGQRYLLFLTRDPRPDQEAATWHPASDVAGIYQADAGTFTRAVPDSGDELPTTLTPEQLLS